MATIYAYKNFNNYYNRIVKGQDINNINDFTAAYGDYDYCQTSTVDNFNENDGVYTSHILGVQNNPYNGDCSYILVCRDNINIDSKWFIVDQNFNCFGQYKLTLYRDVITENWNNILNADGYIERGIVSDSSPYIYNKENITTNQIKKQEILLRDQYHCAWIVGYIAKNTALKDITFNYDTVYDYSVQAYNDIKTTIQANPSTDYYYPLSVPQGGNYYPDVTYYFYVAQKTGSKMWRIFYNKERNMWDKDKYGLPGVILPTDYHCKTEDIANILNDLNTVKGTLYTSLSTHSPQIISDSQVAYIKNYSNKIFKVTDTSKYYRVNKTENTGSVHYQNGDITDPNDPIITIRNILNQYKTSGNLPTQYNYRVNYQIVSYNLAGVVQGEYKVRIPAPGVGNRLSCKECFDMFVMPVPIGSAVLNIRNINDYQFIAFDTTVSDQIAFAQAIAQDLGSNLFDLQLLPYCPLTGITANYTFSPDSNYIDLNYSTHYDGYGTTERYSLIQTTGGTNKGILIWSASNTGSFNIYNRDLPLENKKMQNQTQTIRFSSPNYASQFDMNIAKNDGIYAINIDYTYLPYQPYIHLAPIFKEGSLYGGEYNDARGLILSGDFSISYTKDEWKQYQINNKNYSNIFDRETRQLDLQREVQRTQQITGAILGGIGSAAGAAAQAGIVGGPGVGIAAGALSAGANIAGGIVDYQQQEKLYQENMSARKDIFNMQLENIQALPNSLTKVTAINENNKYFPFIEIYDCTDEEKKAVANYIRSNGMTIGVYGVISDFVGNDWSYGNIEDRGFIKANIIKIDGIEDDTHLLNAINNELYKGVYTK